jgi:glutamate synthase domain-containing protein 1/glutamate synthase domain-containing protein 3
MNYIPSSCGLFGILRKKESEKISGTVPVKSLDSIRHRGSDKGSGYASFNINKENYYYIKIFYDGNEEKLRSMLELKGFSIENSYIENVKGIKNCCYDVALGNSEYLDEVNEILWEEGNGRLYSAGNSLDVFKGVGYPDEVGREYSINTREADLWLAHTRQPTNSPGDLPYWSHPFSSFNIAIIHNGDISSFGANREYLKSKGVKSFVGTDSEVIAYIFRELLKEYDIITAVKIMSGKIDDPAMNYKNRGCVLDGPYTLVIGYDDGEDLYMIGMTDRTKLRPAILGEDNDHYFIASEESQIKLASPDARIWTMEPDSYFIASLNSGIISSGRKSIDKPMKIYRPNSIDIDARDVPYNALNGKILQEGKNRLEINNVSGHRYIGINFSRGEKNLSMYGNPGNCLMNLNENNTALVYGNVADDCCDSMIGGFVKIYGDAGDIMGQALAGGRIYVRGNVGNRACIQMREYGEERPAVIIHGRFDDYLGEYMAGGTVIVLSNGSRNFGKHIGSGMMGGEMFISGHVSSRNIGMQPPDTVVAGMIRALRQSGIIESKDYYRFKHMSFIDMIRLLPPESLNFVSKFYAKHELPEYEYRYLNYDEKIRIGSLIEDFDREMGTKGIEKLDREFTVIKPRHN